MLDFDLIRNAVECGWRSNHINPAKVSKYIEENSSYRTYQVIWNALTDNSGIFTYGNTKYWFYRWYDGTCEVERM